MYLKSPSSIINAWFIQNVRSCFWWLHCYVFVHLSAEYLALLRTQTTERLSMPGSPSHTGLYTPTAPPIQLSTISSVVSIWHLSTTSDVPPQLWFLRTTAILSVFLLYTPDGNHHHVSRELCELIWVCQIRKTRVENNCATRHFLHLLVTLRHRSFHSLHCWQTHRELQSFEMPLQRYFKAVTAFALQKHPAPFHSKPAC